MPNVLIQIKENYQYFFRLFLLFSTLRDNLKELNRIIEVNVGINYSQVDEDRSSVGFKFV